MSSELIKVEGGIAPSDHAFISPSKMGTLAVCPYAANNCKGWIQPPSPAADHGSMLHEAVYNDGTLARLSEEDREQVEYIRREIIKPCIDAGMKVYYETRIEVLYKDGTVATFGTVDFIAYNEAEDVGFFADWKFGRRPVETAAVNHQLKTYNIGLFQRWANSKKWYSLVFQPALGPVDWNNQHEVSREGFDELYEAEIAIIDRAKNAVETDAVPTPDACRYCNKSGCKAYLDLMTTALKEYALTNASCEMPMLPQPELVEYCNDGLNRAYMIKDLLDERMEAMKQVVKANGGSDDYKLTKPRVTRRVDWKAIAEEAQIPEEVINAHTTETIGEPSLIRARRKAK